MQACQPWPLSPCCKAESCPYVNCSGLRETPICNESCQKGYDRSFSSNRFYGKSMYNVSTNTEDIQKEIMKNGPVVALMDVHEDFVSYKRGIYVHKSGPLITSKIVRILGWGSENNSQYWIGTNSWGIYWGIEGFFKIRRGSNECRIESRVEAGLPIIA